MTDSFYIATKAKLFDPMGRMNDPSVPHCDQIAHPISLELINPVC
jgi:hypothetical protein